MRYSLYLYIYNMCNSLQEAAKYIQTGKGGDIRGQLIENCVKMLDSIETTLRNNEESVKEPKIFDLLDICKKQGTGLLNEVGEAIPNQKSMSEFTENVIALKSLYRVGINVTYRIVFFAELGQKWDSMSSVYKAFKDRKDCDVEVVLTPIYRKVNWNGTIKTDVIYEDYLTPLGIRHIPFQQYDITKDLPDMAFISNPYESVTPRQFWPETIAKYSRLVYLPYYTSMAVPKISIPVNCNLPMAYHAWKIIAQSQKVLEMHKKHAPKQGKNVIVTGLPKWDNILELRKKPVGLPEEWEKKLKGKTVFLWNSHYSIGSDDSTLLEYGTAIIELFSKMKNIALIWRPHPMTATIFKLYNPQLQPFWQGLIEAVLNSDNMVIDDNASYALAFQCSDALISDFSSIIAQYMLTKKPVLWLRKAQEAEKNGNTGYLIRMECLEQATSAERISEFIDNITQGIDLKKNQRLKCMREDMPSADGHIGERVCSLLLQDLQKENDVE